MSAIQTLSIKGFKSIRSLDQLELSKLNVMVGANGVGKSNFISFFRMLSELVEGRLGVWVSKQGGADRLLTFGVKETKSLDIDVRFARGGVEFSLEPTVDSAFTFTKDHIYVETPLNVDRKYSVGKGHSESNLKAAVRTDGPTDIAGYCYEAITNWRVFHFHDTSDTAGVKRQGALHDNEYLRIDASNLAAFLFHLRKESREIYEQIVKTVRLAIPFFDDFVLKPTMLDSGEEQIRLLWRQADSDYALWPSQLSDGSLRFVCLVTALLQPQPPSTIIIDEPELGMHPYAITLLGALIRSASSRMQVIISTQSVSLLNEFSLEDIIVVERKSGASVFNRLDESKYRQWLEDYSVGELWEKNILGGRPAK